jgi:hypothetical protein
MNGTRSFTILFSLFTHDIVASWISFVWNERSLVQRICERANIISVAINSLAALSHSPLLTQTGCTKSTTRGSGRCRYEQGVWTMQVAFFGQFQQFHSRSVISFLSCLLTSCARNRLVGISGGCGTQSALSTSSEYTIGSVPVRIS